MFNFFFLFSVFKKNYNLEIDREGLQDRHVDRDRQVGDLCIRVSGSCLFVCFYQKFTQCKSVGVVGLLHSQMICVCMEITFLMWLHICKEKSHFCNTELIVNCTSALTPSHLSFSISKGGLNKKENIPELMPSWICPHWDISTHCYCVHTACTEGTITSPST